VNQSQHTGKKRNSRWYVDSREENTKKTPDKYSNTKDSVKGFSCIALVVSGNRAKEGYGSD
jgi:hypothetical protein